MSTIVVKNLPDHLHQMLKLRAEQNHRSMNREVVCLIETGLQAAPRGRPLPPPFRTRSGKTISIEAFEAAVADGQR